MEVSRSRDIDIIVKFWIYKCFRYRNTLEYLFIYVDRCKDTWIWIHANCSQIN